MHTVFGSFFFFLIIMYFVKSMYCGIPLIKQIMIEGSNSNSSVLTIFL
jgi:hypothetical protein